MRKIVYQGKYLTMSEEEIGGHIYERASLRSGVKILPIKDNKILFIREYRPHEKKSQLKLVGGWVDKDNKTSLEIAQEELREEISLEAKEWKLFYTYETPNWTVEDRQDYFIAENLIQLPKQNNPDSDIIEKIVYLGEKELLEKLENKEILWDKDMLVVLMWFRRLNEKIK